MVIADRDFSKAARLADESKTATIMKNNSPRYVIMEFSEAEKLQTAADEYVNEISERLITKNLSAYRELSERSCF